LFELQEKGIRLKSAELFLDARRVVPFSFVSHGHSDHLRNHRRILLTPPTASFYRHFYARRKRQAELITMNFGEPLEIGETRIVLLPAGHILGSAMILAEHRGVRFLYTGDFKLAPDLTSEPIQVPEADILLMESTFGHPEYRFHRKRDRLPERIADWVRQTQRKNTVPVVLAYTLGKAQEAVAILQRFDFPLCVQPEIERLSAIYRRHGVRLSPCRAFPEEADLGNDVLVLSPAFYRRNAARMTFPHRTLFLSGWAAGNHTPSWYLWDDALPLSDHADFDELMDFVARVRPKKIFTLHGFPEFADILQRVGFDAAHLPL